MTKITKAEARYRHPSDTRGHCSQCTMWRAPDGCTAVEGRIYADGVCELFKRADGKSEGAFAELAGLVRAFANLAREMRDAARKTTLR